MIFEYFIRKTRHVAGSRTYLMCNMTMLWTYNRSIIISCLSVSLAHIPLYALVVIHILHLVSDSRHDPSYLVLVLVINIVPPYPLTCHSTYCAISTLHYIAVMTGVYVIADVYVPAVTYNCHHLLTNAATVCFEFTYGNSTVDMYGNNFHIDGVIAVTHVGLMYMRVFLSVLDMTSHHH